MASYAVEISNLSHSYGERPALHNVSLFIEPGRLFGLLGPNGGGKTTLFRILSTLLRPSSGTASVFGYDTASQPNEIRQRLGVIFQHTALDNELTVLENLNFHGALYGLSGAKLRERIGELLRSFDLEERAQDRVKTLSGGLQRRADLIRALLHRPPLLLLDEPTTGLDPAARHAFWQLLSGIRRAEGTTMLMATHLMDEAEACDMVGIIDQGRIVATGAPAALKQEMGEEALWIEAEHPEVLRDLIHTRFGLEAVLVYRSLQITHPAAHTLLPSLYEAFGERITSVTVRKPTLEDVFMTRTGRRIEQTEPVFQPVANEA
jgi:ABC-2 type transport system ATP-binding protein